MVSLPEFKKFARIYQPASPGAVARGILVLTKDPPGNHIIQVPSGTNFHSSAGVSFTTSEDLEPNESETFQPIGVSALDVGQGGNLQANQTWSSSISGIVATNPVAFSGGEDPIAEISSPNQLVDWTPPDDSILEKNLEAGQKIVLTKLGNPAQLPDDPRIDRSVYLFAQFFTQNTETQKLSTMGRLGDFSKEKVEQYGDRVFKAINREVDSLIGHAVDVAKFMRAV